MAPSVAMQRSDLRPTELVSAGRHPRKVSPDSASLALGETVAEPLSNTGRRQIIEPPKLAPVVSGRRSDSGRLYRLLTRCTEQPRCDFRRCALHATSLASRATWVITGDPALPLHYHSTPICSRRDAVHVLEAAAEVRQAV